MSIIWYGQRVNLIGWAFVEGGYISVVMATSSCLLVSTQLTVQDEGNVYGATELGEQPCDHQTHPSSLEFRQHYRRWLGFSFQPWEFVSFTSSFIIHQIMRIWLSVTLLAFDIATKSGFLKFVFIMSSLIIAFIRLNYLSPIMCSCQLYGTEIVLKICLYS